MGKHVSVQVRPEAPFNKIIQFQKVSKSLAASIFEAFYSLK
ncbi:MAG: hypothetical protein SPH77_02685 [Campylobacter sp.]|nr:hypothetical protein [Campylobacter sp.]MDY6187723.1 hypothetical protein [Campylobacter sp.]